MEGISVTAFRKVKRYWRRQGYRRIDGSAAASGHRMRRAKLGGEGGRRSWRIKIKPKLKFLNKVGSPKNLFIWLRDAYVRMMVGFANSSAGGMVSASSYGGGAIGDGGAVFGRRVVKEYDEKMIIEIYKSVVIAQSNRLAAAGKEGAAVGGGERCGGGSGSAVVQHKLTAIVE
ncbi:hypothetical protein LINGRAHAP2_LOCUS15963 [Linum grandiflorum]